MTCQRVKLRYPQPRKYLMPSLIFLPSLRVLAILRQGLPYYLGTSPFRLLEWGLTQRWREAGQANTLTQGNLTLKPNLGQAT